MEWNNWFRVPPGSLECRAPSEYILPALIQRQELQHSAGRQAAAPGHPPTRGMRPICRTAHTGTAERRYPPNLSEPKITAHRRGSETVFLPPFPDPGQPISTGRRLPSAEPGALGRARVPAATRESRSHLDKRPPPRAVRRRERVRRRQVWPTIVIASSAWRPSPAGERAGRPRGHSPGRERRTPLLRRSSHTRRSAFQTRRFPHPASALEDTVPPPDYSPLQYDPWSRPDWG